MSLVNFTLPYQTASPSPFLFNGAGGHSTVNNLRLNAVLPPPPAPSYNDEEPFQNEPYIPPPQYEQRHQQQQQQQQERHRQHAQQRSREQHQILQQHPGHGAASLSTQDARYANYNQDFRRTQPRQQQQQQTRPPPPPQAPLPVPQEQQQRIHPHHSQEALPSQAREQPSENYPDRPNGYTRVNSEAYPGPDAKTSVHAVLDYDDDFDDYYDDEDQDFPSNAHVTPIQGPIFLKNGSVPVVPLYSYPQLNNGTFVQIPILWTALSVALGVELRGDLVRGSPCIKRYHQLFCPTAGNTYPIDRIERFIDENKALMKRMYGDFEMSTEYGPPTREPAGHRRKRSSAAHDLPDGGPNIDNDKKLDPEMDADGDSFFSKARNTRQSFGNNKSSESGRIDACESKVEIVTPYWASNSAGKIRAIVNTQHFEQAIHQEVCSKTRTNRCSGDCGCEQKYKWHRLLAYDPDNDCKGIFMDWFLFPSCCVCRCDPTNKFPPSNTRN
ncbi:protein spaetzle 3 [Cephus cinctus]|uniref:Protein spaetzle 3 n=1 Tax=Cephus cinctus TaxID=211228 RepID=A0AAJ7VZN4_CEPCN|nr:protein spaetzle 3 [Cephus cinctus]XP_024939153.1 protein spaetzle 3 [Cephus cinctus]XP_024939154.1 protein spaetzle 3 [Cephus cinctus]XP_024939155.1 protein spaetzle 3 [Cephus cinctus]